jgi:hypothetical protein
MKKKDKGMGELLELIRTRPELISALVFDPKSVKRLLRSKAARRLVRGVNVRAFLSRVAGPADGDAPIALCLRRTAVLCPKGTRRAQVEGCPRDTGCPGGTQPPCVQSTCPHPPITCSGTSR